VRTTVDGGIQVTTETTVPLVPPTTIVISGADFIAVNLTYIKDSGSLNWYPAGYNSGSDPYIEFSNDQYGIRVPGFGQALYVNAGTLNIPLAQWDTNPPLGSVAPTGAYTYSTTDVYEWKFGADGTTTFPTLTVPISDNATPSGTGQTIKFGDSSQQAIIFGPEALSPGSPSAQRVIIQGAPGYTGTAGEGGDVYVWAGPGGSTDGNGGDIKVRAGQGDGTGGGGYLNFQAGDSGTGNGGWINIESGETGSYGQGGDITVQARSGGEVYLRTYKSNGANNDWQFGANGTTTLPGAVVKSTVAKTGIAYNTGTATALADSTYIGSIVDGSYGPFTRGLVTFTVVVTSGVAAYTVTATTGNTAVGAVIGTLDTGDLGGTSGSTSNISVADVVQAATAIDLTKSINKLTDGFYTLADGVEGQTMCLVKQTGTGVNVTVTVANGRYDGILYTSVDHLPFTYNESSIDIDTLIFTDGAWQAVGGSWTTT